MLFAKIYLKVLDALKNKPIRLWGISLLYVLLVCVSCVLTIGVPLIALALSALFTVAMTIIYLKGYEGENVNSDMLFDSFRSWDSIKRVLGGTGWTALWILIWSLIPIAGPVIAVIRLYEYRLVPYILALEPDIGIKEARNVSKQRTQGFKLQMFLADFIWVAVISLIAFTFSSISGDGLLGTLCGFLSVILNLGYAAFNPVISGLINAAFYVEIEKKVEGSKYYCPDNENDSNETSKKVCPECGTVVKDNDSFCSNCGAKIE